MTQLTAQFDRQLIQDLNSFNLMGCYEYSGSNKSEQKLIREHFQVVHENGYTIFFSTNKKNIRKIKLLAISKDKLSKKLVKVLVKSKPSSFENVLTSQLTEELTKSIDLKILEDLRKLK